MRPVPAATGLKRLVIAVAAVAAAGLATLVGLSFLIPADTVRDAVTSEIRAVTGLEPQLRGQVSVSFFPSATVSFDDVVLGEDRTGEPAVLAKHLTAHLRYFPLLAGRIQVADVTLVRPTIAVRFDPAGNSNWSALLDSLTNALRPNPDRTASFSEIRINQGTVVLRDDRRGLAEWFRDVELALAWPSISRGFGASGRFVWRDEPVDGSISLTDFLAALSGDRSGVKLRLAGAPFKLAFDGSASHRPTFKLEGTLAADSVSLRDAMQWTGGKPLPVGGFGQFAVKAQTNVAAGVISLSGVNVELDGNAAEGVLTFATDGRQTVQGTLAADTLDFTPYVSTIRLLSAGDRNWNALPIALEGLTGFDLDLRLSAAGIKIGTAKLGRTAVAANLRGGRLNLTIGESRAFGGVLMGSLGIASANGGAEVKSHLQFADVDLESCLGQVFGLHKLAGRGNLAFNIEGSGGSVLAVTNSLNGTAKLTGRQGALAGLNVEQLLRRLERRPLSGSGDFRSGRTPFDQLNVTLKVVEGTVSVDELLVDGPAVRLAVGGQASIPARDLDLKGVATLVSTASATAFELPFVVQGPWDDPIMMPDPQILIRRSGAAAPLLEAVKDRAARDAVRSAIERLTRVPPAAAPASAESKTPE
jgi:AsmA protein